MSDTEEKMRQVIKKYRENPNDPYFQTEEGKKAAEILEEMKQFL